MPQSLTQFIKSEAQRLGFFWCGISKAEFLEEEAPRLESFLQKGFHGEMKYMENHFDKRLNPTLLVDGAKSVISFAFNYYAESVFEKGSPKISRYAYGEDYHEVIKEKLKELLHNIQQHYGEINGRCFVDSAPILDRAWAKKSGLGWVGKNTMLINKQAGSYFFLAEMIVDVALEYDSTIYKDYCGTCNKCVEACPTQAINGDKTMDGSKCISYFTIELKNEIPAEMQNQWNDWMFGCDICQEVCPWNRFAKQNNEPKFKPLTNFNNLNWQEITEDIFKKVFAKSPFKRAGLNKLKQNAAFINLK
jgi:epoxyqueuosine reductase